MIDYSAGVPPAATVAHAGHIGAVRYVSPPRAGAEWMRGKPIHPPEAHDYHRTGLKLAFVWQYGKEADADVLRGYEGGKADARAAQKQLDELGYSQQPVFFAVDFDITLAQWNDVAVHYFRGAAEVLGKNRVGIYGHSRVCHWAGPDDGVVAQVAPGRWLCWVTRAWSRGERGDGYAVLYQHTLDVPLAGADLRIDVSDVLHDEWGWRPLPALQEQPKEVVVPDQGFDTDRRDVITFGRPTAGTKRIIITHTSENNFGTPALNVLNYQARMRNGSYHRMIDEVNGVANILLANSDDWQVWATGNKGNDIALHVCVIGWAKTTREEWLEHPALLYALARVYAFWSRKYDIPLRKLSREELAREEPGVAGHLEAQVWGNTDHWDPGYHLPYDVVLEMARKINSAPAAQLEREDTFMEAIMSNKIQSLINPEKEFDAPFFFGLQDRMAWENRKLLEGLYGVLGLDAEATIANAVANDLAGIPFAGAVPAAKKAAPISTRKEK
ncbi:N-acetylmuramoyl-L-alanine amidase/Domain of unknown function (DUF1906) (plasmid) [Corynebacterium mustelae]|uniref:N-acetylmuramoyl-L-alanine amidase domain-containing protein n=1 Tax=Corynebacterium mustelae TaxID=571915 RepID=A0A0G3GVR0_9CORY|nr:glycoside hydrolase domain-containing protein [Corynebacterium mustelae]AKK05251.1 N-acetylmuramoyl-L-alanine amidase/Domain of unknown function (DUF1906) [Corynebacterium mustelae]AKK07423.1 N-acetylmuramoyl-L-alanine amidase/Domain of unknown function (DUF1906) [Corynebacterium mustelae]